MVARRSDANDKAGGKETEVGGANPTDIYITDRGYFETIGDIARDEGVGALFAGTTPRIGKAVLSGFVQFGTYEVGLGRSPLP